MKVGLIEPYEEKSGIGEFSRGFYNELEKEKGFNRVNLGLEENKLPVLDRTYKIRLSSARKIKELSEEYDHIFIPSHTWVAGFDPSDLECEISVMIHDMERYLVGDGNILQRSNRSKSVRNAVKCDYVFTPSEATRLSLLKSTDIDPDKTYVIGEGVEKIEEYKEMDLSSNYFLYVGDLQKRKNVDKLIQAFEEFEKDDFSLVLAGRVYDEKDRDRILRKIKDNNGGEIHMLGEVTKGELRYLYENTVGYIHPAYFEGYGRTPIEAAVQGAPVAVVKGTAPAEYLDQALKLLPTTKGIMSGLEEIAVNSGDYRLEQSEKFIWESVAEKFGKVILEDDRR